MSESNSVLKSYRFPIILLGAIALGCVIGAVMGERALILKPLGDLFINAMFMVVVPLVFSTICSAVASMSSRYAAPSPRCRLWSASARL